MLSVEFIFDHDCPNVGRTRENLLRAFAKADIPAKWTEWERSSPEAPAHVRQFGSPAILVNGHDIAGMIPNSTPVCRLYKTPDGVPSGIPSIELISQALQRAGTVPVAKVELNRQLTLVPAILFALLPKVACPACWPAYIGLLSAVGLGFLAETKYLLPLTAIFLAIVLAGLVYRAGTRRGYGPFLLGMLASSIVLAGKFMLESSIIFYSGLALLVGSSIWNTWPRKQSKTAPCCNGTQSEAQVISRVPRS